MILPDFVLTSRANQICLYNGLDSIEQCPDKKHFESYPHDITYNFNSRGYRDQEWPTTLNELQNAIWCVGDSFTVGVGSPLTHTWPNILQQATQRRTINVSLDGASNMWIARKSRRIIEIVRPKNLIIHWSYISRREVDLDERIEQSWQDFYQSVADPSWPKCSWKDIDQLPSNIIDELTRVYGGWSENQIGDEDRRLMCINSTHEEDVENTIVLAKMLESLETETKIIHSFIPGFALNSKMFFLQMPGQVIPEFDRLDLARDHHHYDIKTSQYFVNQIMSLLN